MGRSTQLVALALAATLCGCATDYVARTAPARQDYERYDYPGALQILKDEEQHGPERDRLLTLLDEGMLYHAWGRWQESIDVLARAEKLAQSLDITSIHEEAAALITTERQKAYRGEDFEQVMINVLQGLNYAMLGKTDDALVEERRVNERLLELINDDKRPYEQLAIARYLSGVLYEDEGRLDDALIDYKEAARIEPLLGPLAEPLVRIARVTHRDDDLREFTQRYPGITGEPLGPSEGQLVVVLEEGLAPEKVPDPNKQVRPGAAITVPVFVDREAVVPPQIAVDGGPAGPSMLVTNLSAVAKLHLQDRMGRLLARQLAGQAVKIGVASAAAALTKDQGVGVLTWWLLNLSNQPDLRSWMSLPAQFDLARYRLPAGPHTVTIWQHGQQLSQTVTVVPGRISLWVVRQY